jgi:adenylate cyclase
LEAALSLLDETRKLLKGKDDRTEDVRAHGLLALASWRYGQEFTALQHAATTAELIVKSGNPTCTVLEGYSGLAEVYLAHWELNPTAETCRALATQAVLYAKNYARIFPIGRPRACRFEGLLHWLSGHPHRAVKLWQRGLTQANRLTLNFDAALLHYELGRHSPADSPERSNQLAEALSTFERLETAYEIQKTLEVKRT